MRQLYIACVTSIADFGTQLWWNDKTTQKTIQKFQKLQNIAIRRILGAFKGSPSKALKIKAAIPPPEVRFKKACNDYRDRKSVV